MAWRIGIDSGGTFTDVCLTEEETGRIDVWKVPSTPDDPSRGIVEGMTAALQRAGSEPGMLRFLGHGTTVATNALIEGAVARTALLTTAGFRDLLEIGRQKRPSLYDMTVDRPAILVPRDRRFEVAERISADGRVETALDEAAVRAAALTMAEQGVEAVAICFLYGFLHPTHEARAQEILTSLLPDAYICASHVVAPEFREYERLSTTVINAALGPVMQRYLDRLGKRLDRLGLTIAPQLTQSNGGVIGFPTAARLPVRTLLSGPSTGVVAAQEIGRMAGYENLITFDVGGTSSDVALLREGRCRMAGEAEVSGHPIKAPMLDIHTVGAGGGSIAHVDSGGLLKVGPHSAGAMPGPVCYAQGGEAPTVTDANVVLGTLNPEEILGGRMAVRRDLALAAIGGLAARLGLDTMETAQGIVSVATANMAKAIRVISVQRGHDPRDYALMAFGGAGPLHAARLARELDIGRVIVPPTPGTLCALGLLLTDLRADFAVSRLMELSPAILEPTAAAFAELEAQALAWFEAEGIAPGQRMLRRSADMRYLGQNYELPVQVPDGPIGEETRIALAKGFSEAHLRRFGFAAEGERVQIVTLRLEALGQVRKAAFTPEAPGDPSPAGAETCRRQVWLPEAGGLAECPVYDRARLRAGHRLKGPAVIEQMDTTTLILPGMDMRVDPHRNLILETGR